MHWFNPCHLVLLIEIIKGKETHDSIADAIYQLSLSIDKKPVIVNKDVLGFAANRIQFAVLREALYLVEQGVISKEGLDDVMKYGLGFRYACLGPLEVADFGGLDTFYHISDYLMKDLLKNKTVLSFVGGIAATIAGAKFLKSDKARTMAVNSLASGMKLKDDAMATYETIKEDAKDICYEAKAKNEGE